MKTLRFVVFIFFGFTVLMIWNSCKKGPEDPFFSLHSRLQRVCGSWKITSYQVNFVDSIRRLVDSVPNGNGSCGPQSEKHINTYNYYWTFDKHGGFTDKLILFKDHYIDIVNNNANCPDVFEHDSTITVTVDSWNFTSGIGDFKNKEQLYIYNPDTKVAQIFNIVELREKEMKLETQYVDPVSKQASLRDYILTAQ